MKKYFLAIIFLISNSVYAQTKNIFSGVYTLNNKTEAQAAKTGGPYGKITVTRLKENTIALKLRYSMGAPSNNLGIINDTLTVINNQAIYVSKDDPTCNVVFDFNEKEVKVTQNSGPSSFACGFGRNVHVDGVYKKTAGATPATAFKLRPGVHNITIQWIGWEKPGKATITDLKNGTYKIEGEQKDAESSDFLKISGIITPVSKNELSFNGLISSKVQWINKGAVCNREGNNTFKAAPNKKYWRLENKINCEGGTVTDYIDIYF